MADSFTKYGFSEKGGATVNVIAAATCFIALIAAITWFGNQEGERKNEIQRACIEAGGEWADVREGMATNMGCKGLSE